MTSPHRIASLASVLVAVAGSVTAAEPRVSYRNDVLPVLSKAGCNAGTCHGNKSGKGGFKISLRGEDPVGDHTILTRELIGRRINVAEPAASLLLAKPTMRIAHEGGRRFRVDDPEYRILRDWIADGAGDDGATAAKLVGLNVTPTERWLIAPEESFDIRVTARFDDGTTRDVTRLAVYDVANRIAEANADGNVRRLSFGEDVVNVRYLGRQVPVRVAFIPPRPDFTWSGPEPVNAIDRFVFAKLQKLRINPSEVCDDTVFVRRAFLDLLGLIPTAAEAKAFVEDTRSDKRERLVDELLLRPEFADFWALKWADLFRIEEKTLDRKGVQNFHGWIRGAVQSGMPLDRFVREVVSARGSTYSNPPTNFYRAMRDPTTRAETTAQVFLGLRLQCARCHNHPFDRWTQDDYYGWANNFARVDYKILENRRRDRNDKHEFDGEQIVFVARDGEVTNPRIGRPTPPRLLGDDGDPSRFEGDRLERLATWLASPTNDRFAKTMVNRIWFHLLGRGLVDPIDDFRSTNPASHPALLDRLARDFVEHDFDLRHVIRTIAVSRTYQLSATPNDTNADDERNFARAIPRRLSAEQLLDALARVADVPVSFNGYPRGTRATQVPGILAIRARDKSPSRGDAFLRVFGKPPRLQSCECERRDEPTLNQTFEFVTGPLVNELLTRNGNRLDDLVAAKRSDSEIVDALYWAALSRRPSSVEREAALAHVAEKPNRRAAFEDVCWALMNSAEFVLRR